MSPNILYQIETPIINKEDLPSDSVFIPKPYLIVECYNYLDSE